MIQGADGGEEINVTIHSTKTPGGELILRLESGEPELMESALREALSVIGLIARPGGELLTLVRKDFPNAAKSVAVLEELWKAMLIE
jgi:hypothetical protein